MNWNDLIGCEMEYAYSVTEKLMRRVSDTDLEWKPATGENWMTMGRLLYHITEACGFCFRGFVTGDWGMPEGMDMAEMNPEQMMPPAEAMPSVTSVSEALELLAKDREVARQMLAAVTEDELATREAPAPWDPSTVYLGHRLLQMVSHLNSHKSQLFYYLKLQGQPVNTNDLWGA
ncbi:DinB family protein [bacterium]|nr:DinB family protein [candidate division CSSED10-310 bacterium]